MTKLAETAFNPPAMGVIRSAVGSPNGFRILKTLLTIVVFTKQIPTI